MRPVRNKSLPDPPALPAAPVHGCPPLILWTLLLVLTVAGLGAAASETDLKGYNRDVVHQERAFQALERGKTFYKDESYGPAREALQEAFKLDQRLLEARFYLGLVENRLANHKLALEHFEFIYRKKPGYEGIRLELAETHLALGDCSRARAWLNKHLKSNPKSERTLVLERRIKKCFAGKGK